jgi:uncharacterized membrane protein YagU involved in acid resistance
MLHHIVLPDAPSPRMLLWYLRALAAVYLISGLSRWAFLVGATGERFDAAALHIQIATVYFALTEVVAAVGLWSGRAWGIVAWLFAAVAAMVIHVGLADLFGPGWLVVLFHVVSILGYLGLAWWTGAPEDTSEVFRLPPD